MYESIESLPELTPEQMEQAEAERAQREEENYGAYRNAAQKRNNSANIIAEHDDILAELMFEVTMLGFGEEV